MIGATLLPLMLPVASPVRAEKDAAIRAREGDINHWIEYYRKNQQPPQPAVPAQQTTEKEREKGEHAAQQPVAAETNLPDKLRRSQKKKVIDEGKR